MIIEALFKTLKLNIQRGFQTQGPRIHVIVKALFKTLLSSKYKGVFKHKATENLGLLKLYLKLS